MRNLFRFLGSLYYLSENGGDDRIMIDIRCAIVKGSIRCTSVDSDPGGCTYEENHPIRHAILTLTLLIQ